MASQEPGTLRGYHVFTGLPVNFVGNIGLTKCGLLSALQLKFELGQEMGETRLFIEQPLALPGSAKNWDLSQVYLLLNPQYYISFSLTQYILIKYTKNFSG